MEMKKGDLTANSNTNIEQTTETFNDEITLNEKRAALFNEDHIINELLNQGEFVKQQVEQKPMHIVIAESESEAAQQSVACRLLHFSVKESVTNS